MTDGNGRGGMPDTTSIDVLIRKSRQLLRSSWVATGLALTIGLFLGTLLVVSVADVMVPLWRALRFVALLVVVVPATWVFMVGVVGPLFRRLRAGEVARRIESFIPGIHNRLVSCIDLEASDGGRNVSAAFYRRLVSEAIERIRSFRPRTVVDSPSLRRAGIFAGTATAAFVVVLLLLSDRLPTAMARVFSPFADIPPASSVAYTVMPGDEKVLLGDDIAFVARVTKGEPARLRLELQSDNADEPLWYDLQKHEADAWKFSLTGVEHSFNYRVHGGGTWSKQYRITIVERPRIVGLHTVLHYPEYMGMPEPRVSPPQTAGVTGPKESTVEVVVQAEGDVREGEIQLLKAELRRVEVNQRPERIWFDKKLPEGVKAEGKWEWDQKHADGPIHTEPAAAGAHGHQFHSAPVGFQVQKGENLFAYVFIVPDKKPEAIMLQWHDGTNWEHRAYWGADKIPGGKPDTPSRRHLGSLPEAGKWVRLEVPAKLVDLEGKMLKGVGFSLFGGQCLWRAAGTVPPSHVDERVLTVASAVPMQSGGDGTWSGRFDLLQDGMYRVELRNELGHPNKQMKEAKCTVIPDNPPQVVLERPGSDLVLSEPRKVPLTVTAYDDFGLSQVVVSVQRDKNGGFTGRPVKSYEKPQRNDTVVTALDLVAMKLKVGDQIRYRVEARDRKGQSAQTREYVVRIAADKNAADKKLVAFEKVHDAFQEKLVKLISEQAKVHESVETLAAKYLPLSEVIRAAQAATQPAQNQPEGAEPVIIQLDPEHTKLLAELRKELSQTAALEAQTAKLSGQISGELANIAKQASTLEMIPPQLAEQLLTIQQMFQEKALQPMQSLATEIQQAADPKQSPPDMEELQKLSERLQPELETMQSRLDALARARGGMQEDVDEALDELQRELILADAGMTGRELADLSDYVSTMLEELKRLEDDQEQLLEATEVVPEMLFPEVENKQADLEKEAERLLAETRKLLDIEELRRMRREDPIFPEAPYSPEAGVYFLPPAEEDADEPEPEPDKKQNGEAERDQTDEGREKEAEEEEEEPLFLPALGGPRPQLDPRFSSKRRPIIRDQSKEGADDDTRAKREELGAHQWHRLQELNMARQSLAADLQSLDPMLQRLREAAESKDPEGATQLAELMRSMNIRRAMTMRARMGRLLNPESPTQEPAGRPMWISSLYSTGNVRGTVAVAVPFDGDFGDGDFGELDLTARTVIVKMQPKVREELLQSMREEGPEGYRKLINDYFKRLTKVKGSD